MSRKNYLTLLFTVAVLLAGSISAFAQTGPVRGEVKMKKADGTVVPVADAVVEAFRTDIDKGGMPAAKTNKKGEFNFVGFPLGQRFVLSVSGPGIAPQVYPEVKAGMESIVINVNAGDGQKATEAEAREAAKLSASGTIGEVSAADKAKQAELIKKNAEIMEQNKKAEDTNKLVNRLLKEGGDAFTAKNYDLAIAKFDEGYKADPEFAGSAPIMLKNKGLSLRERGITTFNSAVSGDAAAKAAAAEKAKADFAEAITAYDTALAILDKAPADPKTQASYEASKIETLNQYVGLHASMVRMRLDIAKSQTSVPIFDRYFATETDAAKKLDNSLKWASAMALAGENDNAVHAFRMILEKYPDNVDAVGGLGLSLFAVGVAAENKEQMQESLDIMQKFADTAPETHKLKASVKDAVEYLKTEQKLKAQPTKTAPAKRKT